MNEPFAFALSAATNPMDRQFIASASLRLARMGDWKTFEVFVRTLGNLHSNENPLIAMEKRLTNNDMAFLESLHITT